MRILNVMFGKKLGGIEQAFLDYNHALAMHGLQVIPVIHPKAMVRKYIDGNYETIANFTQFDPIAILKIRKLIMRFQPSIIITHGNRANRLMCIAAMDLPVVGVAHNYNFKKLLDSYAIIAITDDLKEKILDATRGTAKVFVVPNMVKVPIDLTYVPPSLHTPIRLGTLSRLERVKGVDIFVEALKILHESGFPFKAVIAGSGNQEEKLKGQCEGFDSKVEFTGWIDDKKAFWEDIDIFCFPSRHESFGIALVEALMHSKLVVSSKAEGPSQILETGRDSLMVPTESPQAMAEAIKKIADNKALQKKLSLGAFNTAKQYSMSQVSRTLRLALEDICYMSRQSR